jgi:hypothetical protein
VTEADVAHAGEGSVEQRPACGGVAVGVEVDAADVCLARRGGGAEAERAERERESGDCDPKPVNRERNR